MQVVVSEPGADAVLTFDAGAPDQARMIRAIHFAYDQDPTPAVGPVASEGAPPPDSATRARLRIASPGQPTYDMPIMEGGLRVLMINGYRGAPGQTLVITLKAAGGSAVGTLILLDDTLQSV